MRRLITGVVLLLILTTVSIWVWRAQTTDTMRTEISDFAVADTNAITRITLKDEQGNYIDLNRQPSGWWSLNATHRARPDAVHTLLHTIAKVRVKNPVSQQAMNTVLKNIISKHSLVEIYTGGTSPAKTYYVGGPDQGHTGTFMLMKESSRPFITHVEGFHGYLTTRYFTEESEWRHRGVFEYSPDEIKSVLVEFPATPRSNFEVRYHLENRSYSCAFGSPLKDADFDTLLLHAYLQNFGGIHYESVEQTKSASFIDSVCKSSPLFTLNLQLNDGNTRLLKGYYKPLKGGFDYDNNPISNDLDRLYIWVDEKDFYVAQYVMTDRITHPVFLLKSR